MGLEPREGGVVRADKELSSSEEEFIGVNGKNESQQLSLVGSVLRLTELQPSSVEGYRSLNAVLGLRQNRANAIVRTVGIDYEWFKTVKVWIQQQLRRHKQVL